MILQGSMYITTDFNVVLSNLMTARIITIGDVQPSLFKQYPQLISGSCIMPSYQLACLMMDNNLNEFDIEYSKYLNSEEINAFISAIFKAVSVGTNIIFYLSQDEAKMRYSEVFLSFLASTRGLIVGTATRPFAYDINYDASNLENLYLENLISGQELLLGYPAPAIFCNPAVINKLTGEFNPYIEDKTLYGYNNYFNNLLINIRNNNSKMLQPVIVNANNPIMGGCC